MAEIELTRKETQDNFVTEKVNVYKNKLLGDYDKNGVYYISPKIVEELIKISKVKASSFDNSLFCVGTLLGYGEITFQLTFSKRTDNKSKASATLYLLEAVDKINGYVQNTIKTKLAVFQKTVTNFMEAAFKFFNISPKDANTEESDDEDEGRSRKLIDDEMLSQSYILAKKQYSLFLDKLADEKCLDAYGKYFTARYSALTKMNNPFSNAVLELFNEEYIRIEKFFLKDKNYKILNELLDKCIEEISGTSETFIGQEKDFLDMTADALEAFTENMAKLHQKMGSKALNMLSKDDKEKVEALREERSTIEMSQETVAVFGERGPIIEEAPPTLDIEVKEDSVEVKDQLEEEPKPKKEVKKKEANVKTTTQKEAAPMADIKGRLDAMRTKAKEQSAPKKEAPAKEEKAPKAPPTAEEKSKAKGSNYSELFNYLNDQNRQKMEEEQRRQQAMRQKDDMGRDM